VRTDAFGFRHFRRFFTDRQVAVVPAFGAGPVTLLAALPFRLGLAWVVELIGAITARLLFRLASELFGLQLAIFAPEILVLLFQGRDASHGISMPALPIPGLLAQFEVFTPQTGHFGTQLSQFLAEERKLLCHRRPHVNIETGIQKQVFHDLAVLPKTPEGWEGQLDSRNRLGEALRATGRKLL
jgi:hypothetical protein